MCTLCMNKSQFQSLIQEQGMNLTDDQWQAVAYPLTAQAVFAGPGSGKTMVITMRAAYLHLVEGLSPEQLLIFTFTRKSASELKHRLSQLNPVLSRVHAGTFHSLFLRLYAKYYGVLPQLITDGENRKLIRQILRKGSRNPDDELIEEAMQTITLVKNSASDPAQLMIQRKPELLFVFRQYEAMKSHMGKWDFDDILLQFYRHLDDRGFLEFLHSQFRSVMVDEFQDTSHVQWLVLQKLCQDVIPLTVVGDDDQSIYGFRGAQSSVIQLFLSSYPNANEVILAKNFRSVDPIIASASQLIAHNVERREKRFEGMVGDGAVPVLHVFPDEWTEAVAIAKKVMLLAQKGDRSVGILARTNHQLYFVVEALWKQGITFSVHDAALLPYKQFDVQNLIKWLKVASRVATLQETQQVFNQFLIGNGYQYANDEPAFHLRANTGEDWLTKVVAWDQFGRAQAFLVLIAKVNTMSASVAYHEVWRAYQPYFEKQKRRRRDDQGSSAVRLVENGIPPLQSLREWLESVNTRIHLLTMRVSPIQVLTMHGAKGLEFDAVFLLGLHDSALPHRKVVAQKYDAAIGLAEERRLFYVGCTRAKQRLWLSYSKRAGKLMCNPSPFLDEMYISADHRSFSKLKGVTATNREYNYEDPKCGVLCSHRLFGEGKIISVSPFIDKGNKVVIQFKQVGDKMFYWEKALEFGHLKIK